jgi:5-oxoprolinase (ATP-hydrolysing) subunit A
VAPALTIDLNADVGEGVGGSVGGYGSVDDALLQVVTSANVACGYHAGDASTMRAVCAVAVRRGVAVGAHVSYDDRAEFGRRFVDLDPAELADIVLYQVSALAGIARAEGLPGVSHVKPHGALYNAIVHHERQAAAVLDGIAAFDPSLPVLGLPGSVFLRLARERGHPCVAEAFADRGYAADGTLVPRSAPGALVHDVDAVVARGVRLAVEGVVTSVTGVDVEVSAASICVHGDTPGAVLVARAVRSALEAAGVRLSAP